MLAEARKDILQNLLSKLERGEPVLIIGLNRECVPSIHNFYPKKYYGSIQHRGWGFFEGRTEHGTFSFDGGGAMQHHHFEDGTWLSWSSLRVDNPEVLKDLEYDCNKVAVILREVIEESTPKCPEHREFDRVREL